MIEIPSKLNARLNEEHRIIILDSLIPFSHLLQENKLYFFPEYTDHGINHINGVLRSIENLISDDTFDKLSSLDICAIIIATVLHDIGMHTSPEMFRNMLTGEYDNIPDNLFKEKTWKELWDEFLKDSRFWNEEKKEKIFGDKGYNIAEPNLVNLTENDIKFIGEFIRIHHARLACEIALNGYKGDKTSIVFNFEKNQQLHNKKFLQISGLIARSHGMNVRDTFAYLKPYGKALWKKPLDIKVVFLMTLIRLADYIQIDSSRTDELMLKLRKFSSQFSLKEHETHLAIDHIHLDNADKELICVEASPEDAMMYVKIDNLLQDIQKEFDLSWAILGEVYGDHYKLRYRRIESNLTDENVKNDYTFVPKQFGFKFNNELSKLLIAPLYGNDPSYGVRELVQNAVDACRTRMAIDEEYEKQDITHVTVSFDSDTKLFTIVDTGVGMTIEEIDNYFLTIGSSYNNSAEWQKTKEEKNENRDINKIYRTGRFGIGILAAFLLGPELTIKTKSIKGIQQGYQFTMSLNKSFIQIDKVSDLNYGTTITIGCKDSFFKKLDDDKYDRLLRWYIDSKPKVVYYYNKKVLTPNCKDVANGYKTLVHTSDDYGDIYWKPVPIFTNMSIRIPSKKSESLFCNGFMITDNSQKRTFSMKHNVECYLQLRIPSLIISDIFNCLPLNLQRNNIDPNADYSFEKELVIAVCKDVMCQLLAIDHHKNSPIHKFFFNQSGYIINSGRFLGDILSYNSLRGLFYREKCLQGKTLVHVFGSKLSFENIHTAVNDCIDTSDTFISFYSNNRLHFLKSNFYKYLKKVLSNSFLDSVGTPYVIAVNHNSIKHFKNNSIIEDRLCQAKQRSGISFEESGEYSILKRGSADRIISYTKLAEKIIGQFNSEISLVVIYKNGKNVSKSSLDGFFNDYAGGDLIIPYEEKERKNKFAKLYKECSGDIEEYRQLFEKEFDEQ